MLAAIEFTGQVAYFLKKGQPLYEGRKTPNDKLLEKHPFLGTRVKKNVVVEKKEGRITTTDIGTRWTGAPADDQHLIRVALLGGSTTFATMVRDEDSWPALLQSMLGNQYAVINYGTASYTTAESIIQMALLVPEKHPDIVLFYAGWNDIANYHDQKLGPDYYSHGIKQIESNMENERFKNTDWLWFQARERIFIFKLAHILRQRLAKQDYSLPVAFDTPDPFVDRIYLRNLRTLKLLASAISSDTEVVFVPQILNYADFKDRKRPRIWSRFINDYAMPKLMDRFNSIMSDVCQAGETRCTFINDVVNVDWQSSDFKDDGHFSRQGGLKFAPIIAEKIKEIVSHKQP